MSLHFFTVLAQSLWKIRDLELRPARIHSLPKPCRFASHVVAQKQTLTGSTGKARCGRLPGAVHPLSAGQRQIEARENGRLWCAACQSDASFCGHLQISVSVKRHLSRIFPCLTRSLASVLIPRPAAAARLCFALRAPYGLRLSENLFGKTPHRTRTKRFSEPSAKAPLGLGSGAHSHPTPPRTCVGDPGISRRFAHECPE